MKHGKESASMSEQKKARQYSIVVEQIKAGWAAIGNGWAVHADTLEHVLEKYREREEYYDLLAQQLYVVENENNMHEELQRTC